MKNQKKGQPYIQLCRFLDLANLARKNYTLPFVLAIFLSLLSLTAGSTNRLYAAPLATNVSGVVNTYAPVTNISGNDVTIGTTAGATTPFAVGDYAMLIQMTGVAPVQSGSNMGNYELLPVTGVSGSTITLGGISNSYSFATEAVQLVRVPYDAGTMTATAQVNAKPWDGSTGGIIALKGGTLSLSADIDASGTGFTNSNGPTTVTATGSGSGSGNVAGRGADGDENASPTGTTANYAGLGGGGETGGGVANTFAHAGGGTGGGGLNSDGTSAAGTDGGSLVDVWGYFESGVGGGGGGGVIGGGGGGGGGFYRYENSANYYYGGGAGGGGIDGGGGGGAAIGAYAPTEFLMSASGGGPGGVGDGGNGAMGGTVRDPFGSGGGDEGSGGGGGGSYGGGGGAGGHISGGDDGSGGGGGGSWAGGGTGGVAGDDNGNTSTQAYDGGDGNTITGLSAIPDSEHYLNTTNPRLMLGGSGGGAGTESSSSLLDGGAGGGIVFLEFDAIDGNGNAIRSNGDAGQSSTAGTPHSGSGGGGGGQIRLTVQEYDSTTNVLAEGGAGGTGTADSYHGGSGGGAGGGGGIWFDGVLGVADSTNTGGQTVTIPNVTWDVSGATGGQPITNPKNSGTTAGGGYGGTGLATVDEFIITDVLIGNRVWYEDDGDGDATTGVITPVIGATVTARASDGTLYTAITDSSGYYTITVPANTAYTVYLPTPIGYSQSTVYHNSDSDPASGDDRNHNSTGTVVAVGTTNNLTIDFGFTPYSKNYCVESTAEGFLDISSLPSTNQTGNGSFNYPNLSLPGHGTVTIDIEKTAGAYKRDTSAIDSGTKKQLWLDQGYGSGQSDALFIEPNSGTITVTYSFADPMGNFDLILLDLDEADVLYLSAKDSAGNIISDFSGWRFASGDLSDWDGSTPGNVAEPAIWNAANATITAIDSDDGAGDHRSFAALTPDVLVTEIQLVYPSTGVDGRHVYSTLYGTLLGRDNRECVVIGDRVWIEDDGDGDATTGVITPSVGSLVTVIATDGTVYTDTTDINGYYTITVPGNMTYTVSAQTPVGMTPSAPLGGNLVTDTTNGNDLNHVSLGTTVVVGTEDNLTIDFGFYEPPPPTALCYAVGDESSIGSTGRTVGTADPDILLAFDGYTGVTTNLGQLTSLKVEAIEFDPNTGILYAADADTWGSIDLATNTYNMIGSFTPLTSTVNGSLGPQAITDVDGIAYDPVNDLWYGAERNGSSASGGEPDLLFQFDPTTGAVIPNAFGSGVDYVRIEPVPNLNDPTITLHDIDDLGFDPASNRLYGIANIGVSLQTHLVLIDRMTGDTINLGQILYNGSQLFDIEGLTVDPDGRILVTTGNKGLVVDPDTGVSTPANSGAIRTSDTAYVLDVSGSDVVATLVTTEFGLNQNPGGDYEALTCMVYSPPVTIGDTVWYDADGDGNQNGSETGISDVVIELLAPDGTVAYTTTTSITGTYLFEGLPPGQYTVTVSSDNFLPGNALEGYTQTGDPDGTMDDQGTSADLLEGESDLTLDFGYVQFVMIGDRVWIEDDGDGDATTGNITPVIGSTVTALGSSGVVYTDTTNAMGYYTITVPADEAYTVTVGTPTGTVVAVPTGGLFTTDNNPTTNNDTSHDPAGTTVTVGTIDNLTIDFGFYEAPEKVALGNLVWIDEGAGGGRFDNGIVDGIEAGLDGVTVELYAGTVVTGTPLSTTATSGNGFYLFDQLEPGDYVVHIPASQFAGGAPLAGYFSSTGAGSDDTNDDNVDENGLDALDNGGISSAVINLTPNTEPTGEGGQGSYPGTLDDDNVNMSVDFGFTQLLCPVSQPTYAEFSTGHIFNSDAGYGTLDNVNFTYSFDTSAFEFWDIASADIVAIGADSLGTTPSGSAECTNWKFPDHDTAGATGPFTMTFNFAQPIVEFSVVSWPASDFSIAWEASINGNSFDPSLWTLGGSTTLSNTRFYNDHATFGEAGWATLTNSSTPVSSLVLVYYPDYTEVSVGSPYEEVELMFHGRAEVICEPLGSIGDYIWLDTNNDGNPAGENGAPNVIVMLEDSSGSTITTTTTITGAYLFPDLPYGTYTVTVDTSTLPAGYLTTPSYDPDGGANSISVVTLDITASHNLEQDFGYPPIPPVVIGDRVWIEDDNDGDATTGIITPVVGSVVTAIASDGTVYTDTTDSSGLYTITVPANMTYTVSVTNPVGTVPTPLAGGSLITDTASGSNLSHDGSGTTVIVGAADNLTVDFGFYKPILAFELNKTLNTPMPVRVGERISFTIRITNSGTAIMTQVPLTDTYSNAYMSYTNVASPVPDIPNAGELVWSDLTSSGPSGFGTDLNPGETFEVVVEFITNIDTTSLPNESTLNIATSQGITDTAEVQAFAPTSVGFIMREVTYQNDRVLVQWQTADESDLVGFHIYRQVIGNDDGQPIKLTLEMLIAEKSGSPTGASYTYEDASAEANVDYRYFVGIFDTKGFEAQEQLGEVLTRRTVDKWLVFLPITMK